jgi:hypothetical protein
MPVAKQYSTTQQGAYIMFCETCGNKLNPNVKFCGECGNPVAPPARPTGFQSAYTTTNQGGGTSTTRPFVMAKTFRCPGCDSPLKIPQNAMGKVICPSCQNECLIEGLIRNAEIAAKENINSGFPLFATSAKLHSRVVSFLCELPTIPLDVFEKAEVVREEHYCVSAYCFYCNGTASFNYEVGSERKQTYTVNNGNQVEIREKTHIDWTPGSSTAAVSLTLFAPGSREMAPIIQKLYTHLNPNKLIDIEQLEFPPDVNTYGYDMPQPAAFSEYVAPIVERMLRDKAFGSVANMTTKNLNLLGSSIQKEVVRVFLGLYRIVLSYANSEYAIWVSGDGQTAAYENLPKDPRRGEAIVAKMEEMVSAFAKVKDGVQKPSSAFNIATYICIIVCVVCVFAVVLFGDSPYNESGNLAFVLLLAAFFLGMCAGVFKLLDAANKEKHSDSAKAAQREVLERYNKEFDDLKRKEGTVFRQFRANKQALRGIYQGVSGDPNAF